jgi:ubiquinone/menaquinone biosynthesis C-methylase UbiE
MTKEGLDSYIIRGGKEGRDRLGVLARVLRPTTAGLLDRAGPIDGAVAIDVGCGGGDVTFDLAERVGPRGRVFGLDLDETKLALARDEAKELGIAIASFHRADVGAPWPAGGARVVYARFILTHLPDPTVLLRRAKEALLPGGFILAEDIDFAGHFCDPACPAFERYQELYLAAARKRGADPFIGRRLGRLLEDGGFAEVGIALVQPIGRDGDAKRIASLTFAAISGGIVAAGLATEAEVAGIQAELDAFTARPDTTLSLPRIFQAWGRRESE